MRNAYREAVRAVAFRMFDVNGAGFVTEEDLTRILEKGAGSNMSAKQLQMVCLRRCCDACAAVSALPEMGDVCSSKAVCHRYEALAIVR